MKKLISLILSVVLCLSLAVPSFAATSDEMLAAAELLHSYGLFNGTGTKADGTPEYDLYTVPTRAQAVTMLVRLLGKEAEAQNTQWTLPFTDVPSWATPYIGYAYNHSLTQHTQKMPDIAGISAPISMFQNERSRNLRTGLGFQLMNLL